MPHGGSGERSAPVTPHVWEASELLGSSRVMCSVRAQLARLAAVPFGVRLEGGTGSGKGVAARLLHAWSLRAHAPFVACNLNALPGGLEVAELVGHGKGSFTGAISDSPGAFEAAHGGTLFLDEIATASGSVQLALLQLIDEKTVRRVGEQRARLVDVRLVFATNADLEAAVVRGDFRRDLYYRLPQIAVRMPSLKEHKEDIPELVGAILMQKARDIGTRVPELPQPDLDRLMDHDWPGNVRELDRVLEYFVTFHCLPALGSAKWTNWRSRLTDTLERNGGNRTATARELGVSRKTLHQELKRRSASGG